MKILLVGMMGLYNRGCEAIVWGSAEILRQAYPGAKVSVAVGYPDQAAVDRRRLPSIDVDIFPLLKRPSIFSRGARRAVRLITGRAPAFRRQWAYPQQGWDLVLEVGGDTLCGPGAQWRLEHDRALMARYDCKVGLWGMNFGPKDLSDLPTDYVTDTLSRYHIITVRDEPSRHRLAELGIVDNVYRMADPAFAMAPEPWDVEPHLPREYGRGLIGLNLSPCAAHFRDGGLPATIDLAVEVCTRLASAGFGILLVPHCFPPACPPADDDLAVLRPALERLRSSAPSVGVLPNGISSPQVKYAISRCSLYAGARMHSTIAAWSTGVPVLSISYSPKSRSLNQEIYGHEHYLVDIRTTTPEEITERLLAMHAELDAARVATRQGVEDMLAHTDRLVGSIGVGTRKGSPA